MLSYIWSGKTREHFKGLRKKREDGTPRRLKIDKEDHRRRLGGRETSTGRHFTQEQKTGGLGAKQLKKM